MILNVSNLILVTFTDSYNNVSHIGCTTGTKKRRAEHRDNETNQFGRALSSYGYDNFQFEILETVKVSEIHNTRGV